MSYETKTGHNIHMQCGEQEYKYNTHNWDAESIMLKKFIKGIYLKEKDDETTTFSTNLPIKVEPKK